MIHKGKEQAERTDDTVRLYEIQENHSGIRCVEVRCTSLALKSHAVFLVRNGKENLDYIWKGSLSRQSEVNFTKNLTQKKRKKEGTLVTEGGEPLEFWKCFPNGKEQYPNMLNPQVFVPRLFHYLASHTIEEVVHFCQDDLNRDDVYMLDTYYAVFVWQYKSRLSDEKELKIVLEIAKEYIEAAPDGRKNCTGYFVPGGNGLEPLCFTCAFHGWDPTPKHECISNLQKIDDILSQYKQTFTYQELLEGKYPKGTRKFAPGRLS